MKDEILVHRECKMWNKEVCDIYCALYIVRIMTLRKLQEILPNAV
jgi:hypothetical protein